MAYDGFAATDPTNDHGRPFSLGDSIVQTFKSLLVHGRRIEKGRVRSVFKR
jgi:hypothetical protein